MASKIDVRKPTICQFLVELSVLDHCSKHARKSRLKVVQKWKSKFVMIPKLKNSQKKHYERKVTVQILRTVYLRHNSNLYQCVSIPNVTITKIGTQIWTLQQPRKKHPDNLSDSVVKLNLSLIICLVTSVFSIVISICFTHLEIQINWYLELKMISF